MSDHTPESPTLAVCGEFNIFTAAAMKEQLMTTLAANPAGHDIDIDLSDVTDIDTAGIQLMLMAKREAATQGKTLRFVRHSDAVLDLFDLCDLASHFGDPVLIRSQTRGPHES